MLPPPPVPDERASQGLVRLALLLRFSRLYVSARARAELSAYGADGPFEPDLEGLEAALAGRDVEGAAELLAEESVEGAGSIDRAMLRLLALRVAFADAAGGGTAAEDGAVREQEILAARLLFGRAAELARVGFGEQQAGHSSPTDRRPVQ